MTNSLDRAGSADGSLRRLAMQIAIQVPDDPGDAATVMALVAELVAWRDPTALARGSPEETNVFQLRPAL